MSEILTPLPQPLRWDARLSGWLFRRGFTKASWWIADFHFWLHRVKRRK